MNEDPRSIDGLQRALGADFQIERLVGRGSTSTVYEAWERALDRAVAIKILHPALAEDVDALQRFEQEAKAVAALNHPHVARAYRFGRLPDGTPYLVMHLVKGRSMRERLTGEGMLAELAIPVLEDVASALAAAHAIGIVHRDVRPENVLWDEASDRALLVDFGVSALLESAGLKLTSLGPTGSRYGDPKYLSPEQIGGGEATARTDIYCFGVFAYELLTGEGPYGPGSDEELIEAHLHAQPRDLSKIRDDVERNIARVLDRCLDKDPERRPAAADVSQALAGVWQLPPPEGAGWRPPWRRR